MTWETEHLQNNTFNCEKSLSPSAHLSKAFQSEEEDSPDWI